MDDMISRRKAIEAFPEDALAWDISDGYIAPHYVRKILETLPSAEPRPMGRWQITDAYPHNVHCSVCHKRFAQTHWAVWEDGTLPRNFCPNCGADMRGDTE